MAKSDSADYSWNNNGEYTKRSDEELVDLCRNGDDAAFNVLMKRYAAAIYNFSLQYVHNPDDAQDIAQEAFFKTWKNIKHFKAGSRFRPWLYTIARNTALDHIKKKKAYVFSSFDDIENDISFEENVGDDAALPDEVFALNELAENVISAMEILHPDHRAVMLMHYRDNMTFDEIAIILDKPMNTVKSWHRRALSKIKGSLHHYKP